MRHRDRSTPLPARASAGLVIGGWLAGLEQLIANRPPVVAQVEEPIREGRVIRGYTVRGFEQPIARRERRDTTGARL